MKRANAAADVPRSRPPRRRTAAPVAGRAKSHRPSTRPARIVATRPSALSPPSARCLASVVRRTLDDQSLYNILLLAALIMTYAVDTSVCERGFALMNNLKDCAPLNDGQPTALYTLMTICELGGKEWDDASKIPVDEIVEEWRSQSKKGRYESAMWKKAGLEEPGL